MKLFCDITPLTSPSAGIGVYTKNLLQGLHALDPAMEIHGGLRSLEWKMIQQFHVNFLKKYGFFVHMHFKYIPGRITGKEGSLLWKIANFHANDYDIVHMPASLCPIWENFDSRRNTIITVHDMYAFHDDLPINHSWYENEIRQKLPDQMKEAAAIITVSQYSKKEILQFVPVNPVKIHVIPNIVQWNSTDETWKTDCILHDNDLEKKPYFLAVGTLRPHKNYANLIRGFRKYMESKEYHGEKLVIVGLRQPDDEEAYQLIQSTRNVIHFSGIHSNAIKQLYHHAIGFFLISFMEGFGIPLLEAMSCGCPACYSSGTSLQEIGRSAAFSVPPEDIDAISLQFARFAAGGEDVRESVQQCLKIANEYTMESVSKKTMSLYHEVMRKFSV